ncbi:unnamed protein product [Schistocephalus solidus]|uniref:Velvet domain-containing protein n=1 Tax=Schistocephalus solidus TaxID=70667 RepID=A0A183T861_SCHSO|nr:unnamed protein product [Schistocephalus solidus]
MIYITEVSAPSQLRLPQHGVDAEDPGPLQDFRVRDPVFPSQLQYSAEAAEMEVIQLPGLIAVDGLGLRSVNECRKHNGKVIQLPGLVQVDGPGFRSVKECCLDDGLYIFSLVFR